MSTRPFRGFPLSPTDRSDTELCFVRINTHRIGPLPDSSPGPFDFLLTHPEPLNVGETFSSRASDGRR